jgi:uncharacterized protein
MRCFRIIPARKTHRNGLLGAVLAVVAAQMAQAVETARPLPAHRDVMVAMRDGVHLATDVYLPPGGGPLPVVLMRTPYDKGAERSVSLAAQGVARGYAVVLQDCRGRFASQGANLPFSGESLESFDGHDTLAWVRSQRWSNGKIGTVGGSATGITQLFLAPGAGRELVCQHISVAPPSLYHEMVYPGGIFHNHLLEAWFSFTHFQPQAVEIWRDHPTYDDYWKKYDMRARAAEVAVSAVHVGGYFDIFAAGTISAFRLYQQGSGRARNAQKLVLGPWTHAPMIEHSGVLRFRGADRPPGPIADEWAWFDHHLRGAANGIDRTSPVTYYVMGDVDNPGAAGNAWRQAKQWPPASVKPTVFHLHHDGSLARPVPGNDPPRSYVSDPADPCPTIGGLQFFAGITIGTQDQRPLESRADVLVFSSPPLQHVLEVTGAPVVKLWISSEAVDADFFVKLCDVYPDGRSINVSEGQLRARFRESFERPVLMRPGEVYPLTIEMAPTSIAFNKGHRLRVLVSSSSSPGFAVNPQTGESFLSQAPGKRARHTVHLDAERPSQIILPVDRRR